MTKSQDFLYRFNNNDLVYTKKICHLLNISVNHAKQLIFYYQKKGILKRIYSGYYIFAYQETPSKDLRYEFACSVSGGYISGEHVLSENSVINADFSQFISCISLQEDKIIEIPEYNITIDIQHIKSKKIFYNTQGIVFHSNYSIASPERAMLDIWYSKGIFLCDNKDLIDTSVLNQLKTILPNKKANELAKYTQNTAFNIT